MNNQISKRELERRLNKSAVLIAGAREELQKWHAGFIKVGRFLKEVAPEHEFFKTLPLSTLKMIEENQDVLESISTKEA